MRKPKLISLKDDRIRNSQSKQSAEDKMKKYRLKKKSHKKKPQSTQSSLGQPIQHQQQLSSTSMYFHYNQHLGPPFHVICDTNFINFSIKNKIDIEKGLMDCLLAKTIPYVTDCVVAELEKLGSKYRVALRIVKNSFQRLTCNHQGTYADDCIVNRVIQHKCYIVGTCDKGLKRRIRKIPGVPIMFILQHQYTIERMPDAYGCRKWSLTIVDYHHSTDPPVIISITITNKWNLIIKDSVILDFSFHPLWLEMTGCSDGETVRTFRWWVINSSSSPASPLFLSCVKKYNHLKYRFCCGSNIAIHSAIHWFNRDHYWLLLFFSSSCPIFPPHELSIHSLDIHKGHLLLPD